MSQEKKNRAVDAQQLKDNALLQEALTAIKAANFEAFTKVCKDGNYEENLKHLHDNMQAVNRLESYIEKVITEGRIVDKPRVLQGDI